MIAAHALSVNAILVTNNNRHYERIKAPLILETGRVTTIDDKQSLARFGAICCHEWRNYGAILRIAPLATMLREIDPQHIGSNTAASKQTWSEPLELDN